MLKIDDNLNKPKHRPIIKLVEGLINGGKLIKFVKEIVKFKYEMPKELTVEQEENLEKLKKLCMEDDNPKSRHKCLRIADLLKSLLLSGDKDEIEKIRKRFKEILNGIES